MYRTLLFLHLLSVVVFVGMHGVSAWVSFALKAERDADRIRALLDISAASRPFTVAALMLIVLSGAALATIGHTWSQFWVWGSVGLLVVIYAVMVGVASRYYTALRIAVGLQEDRRTAQLAKLGPVESAENLARRMRYPMAWVLLAVGGIGLGLIVWMMYYKPTLG